MRAEAKPRRRIWPWILIAILAISATIIAVSIANGTWGTATPTASPATDPTATTAPPLSEPTGCLGGPTRDGAMVLAAQATAGHDSTGAIEAATAFVRFLNQYPYPGGADLAAVEDQGLASDAPTKDLQAFFATDPNLSGGLVPDGTTYFLSTVPGVYHLESAAADDAIVTVGTALVVDGALSPTLKGSITVTVRWEDGAWKFVSSEGTRTTEDLYAIGKPYLAGC